MCSESQFLYRESHRGEERVVRRTQSEGCAAGGFPSGLGWEVGTGIVMRVIVCTLDIIKNKIKQLVAIVVLVGTSPVV